MIAKRTPNRDRVIAALAPSLPSVGYRKPGSDEIVVNIRGEIDRQNNSPLVLEALLKRNRGAPFITVNINSQGGLVRPAIQIHNLLKESGAFVRTIADKQCASAAGVILMAGKLRQAASTSTRLLLHSPVIEPESTARWTSLRHTTLDELSTDASRGVDIDQLFLGLVEQGRLLRYGHGKWRLSQFRARLANGQSLDAAESRVAD